MILSFLFLTVEPISALMLLALVLRYRYTMGIHRYARFFLAILAGGLVLHHEKVTAIRDLLDRVREYDGAGYRD